MQTQLAPAPEDVRGRLRPFFLAKVIELALVELRQDLAPHVQHRAGIADDEIDARPVRARVPRAKLGRQPRVATLHVAQEAGETLAGEVAARQDSLGGP